MNSGASAAFNILSVEFLVNASDDEEDLSSVPDVSSYKLCRAK